MSDVRRVAWVAVVALAAAGCSIGDVRRSGPTRPTAGPATSESDSPGPEVRRARLPLGPKDNRAVQIEFVDAKNGYALLLACGDAERPEVRCVAGLAATQNGGLTWRRLEHPHPTAGNHQMYAPTRETVVLFAEPGGWFVSTASGESFGPRPEPVDTPPREYFADRPLERWCEPSPCHLVDHAPEAGRPANQPGLPGMLTSVVSDANGRVVAASVQDGQPYTAISMNRGQAWQRFDVSVPDGMRLTRAEVATLGRYPDIWLYGYQTESRTEFPLLWLRSGGPGWLPITPAEQPGQVLGLAPMGRGQLAVLDGGGRFAVVDGRYQREPTWPAARSVRALRDGTLAATGSDGSTWLGLDELGPGGPRRRWVQIIIEVG